MASIQLRNVNIEICYGSENANLGKFFQFLEKRHGTKRHINAILAAEIDTVEKLERALPTIGLLRGLGEKSAKEVIEAYEAYKESIMTDEQKKQKEVQTWNLTRVAQETPYEVGEKVFFFQSVPRGYLPCLKQGVVRAVKLFFGYSNSQRREIGQKTYDFKIYVWDDQAGDLMEMETRQVFRTKKDALASIKVSE